jgi:hypothetical protein
VEGASDAISDGSVSVLANSVACCVCVSLVTASSGGGVTIKEGATRESDDTSGIESKGSVGTSSHSMLSVE